MAIALSHEQGWHAGLKLGFARRDARSVLVSREHAGPLRIQKALYPEGDAVCHAIILHPPGGVAGGDSLALQVDVAEHAHALLTTPGAAKWYKANGLLARQQIHLSVATGAILEWLPQETIIYNQANADWQTQIDLAAGAVYAGWEINVLGRRASGESFVEGRLVQHQQIQRDGALVWHEQMALSGDDALLSSAMGLAGAHVFATMLVLAGNTPPDLLARCRELRPLDGAKVGLSALPEVLVARYLGQHPLVARAYFEQLWAVLRPWYAQRAASPPRIWNT